MARKKAIEETTEGAATVSCITETEDKQHLQEFTPTDTVISPAVEKLLKVFATHKEIWISPLGGVYTSQPNSVRGAILYKNPYYKS